MKVIICIDDEKIILESLSSQLLRNFGTQFHYEFAESAEEAEMVINNLIEEGLEIHCVICDWLMPGVKGDEFLYKIAKQLPDCNKVLLTGHMDSETVKSLACCNEDDIACIFKPWEEKDLLAAIAG